jgi:tripartite-type tricarboxylate transporter receptor subunit TctC
MTLCGAAQAQAPFPTKPVRVIVASGPAGAMDAIARVMATKLSEALGQPVIVDNRGGANGAVAAELTAKSPPDGHTLMMGGNGNLAIAPFINKNLGYDPLKDLAPVTSIGSAALVLVVHPTLPVKTVKEFIALAKARPGQLSYGTPGIGSGQHLAGSLFQNMAKIDLLHVPYKGGGLASADLMAGNTQAGFSSVTSTAPYVSQGKVRPLAVTAKERSKVYPQLPTISEAGLPGYEAQNWYGLVVPAKTPEPVVARLNKEIVQIFQLPQSREPLLKLGIDVGTGTPEAFGKYMKSEYDKWGRVIREAGIKE